MDHTGQAANAAQPDYRGVEQAQSVHPVDEKVLVGLTSRLNELEDRLIFSGQRLSGIVDRCFGENPAAEADGAKRLQGGGALGEATARIDSLFERAETIRRACDRLESLV